jgi:hypothetical protein
VGDTAVIGAPLRDSFTGGFKADAGAAYVWTRSGSAWMLASTLTASEQGAGEHFGAALDMVAGRVVIGAPLWDNPAAEHFDFTTDSGSRAVQIGMQVLVSNTYNTTLGERGFVYQYIGEPATINLGTENYRDETRWMTPQEHGRAFVFEGSGSSWTRIARLTADGGLPEAEALIEGKAGDHFGAAVAIDGDFVAVGAPGYDGTALNQGAGYVFYRLPDAGWGSGPSWAHATGFKEHDFTSDDGSEVIDRGAQVLTTDDYDLTRGRRETVYRYIGSDDFSVNLATENYLNRNLWVEVPNSGKLLADRPAGSSQALTPPYNTADRFGTSVAVGGGRVVIGMPGFNETASDGVVLRADVGAMRTYSTDLALPSGDSAMWAEVLRDPRHANLPSDAASRFGSVTHYDPTSRTLFVADPGNNVVYTYVNEGLYWRPVQTINSPDSVFITAAGLTANYYDIPERNTLPTSFTGELTVPLISGNKEFAVYKGITGGSFAPDAISNSGDRTVRPPESDTFAARWSGEIYSTSTQNVVFHLGSDDGSKLFIDSILRINNDGLHPFQTISSASFQLTAGAHTIEVQFFEKYGGAGIRLDYEVGGVTRLLTGPFGKDIDVESGWMVIGAPDAKTYVYSQSGENWNLTQELSGAGGFGTSVAISASKLVVGMPSAPATYASWGQADPNYNLNLGAAGGAVVYNRSGSFWFQDRLLMPDDSILPAQTSYWGTFSPSDWNQVHIQGKGWYPIGGHWVNEGNGTEVILKPWMMMAAVDYNGGDWHAWWLFNFSGSDSTQYLPGSIDDDIEYIIVGSVQDLSGVYAKLRRDGVINTYYGGAHYVYERNDSYFAVGPRTIALAMDISGGDSGFQSNWNFGGSGENVVTMSGSRDDDIDYLAVASTRQVTTTRVEYNSFVGLEGDRWGSSVDIIGNTVLVGAPGRGDSAGRVGVYNLLSGDYSSWTSTIGSFTDAPLRASQLFNAGLSLGTEVVGVPGSTEFFASLPNANSVQRYFTTGGSGGSLGSPSGTNFGANEALSINANRMLIGAPDGNGRVHLYNSSEVLQQSFQPFFYNTSTSVLEMRTHDDTNLHFGAGGQVISRGFVVVGTANDTTLENKLYNFRQRGPDFTPVDNDLLVPEVVRKSETGASVAIDGNTAVVGARDFDNRGAVFVYLYDGVVGDDDNHNGILGDPGDMDYWTLQATVQARDIQTDDRFGFSVALSGDFLIVGAPEVGNSQGAAYLFERLGTAWTQSTKFVGGLGDRLGTDVDVFGGTAIAGAPGENAAFIYSYNGLTWTQTDSINGVADGLSGEFGASVALDQNTAVVGAPSAATNHGAAGGLRRRRHRLEISRHFAGWY